MTALYIAPHFDDAVLSCAGGMLARAAGGERVTVCTVFTRSGDAEIDRIRAGEDRAAMALIGGESIALDGADAPLRLGVPASFRALVLEPEVDRRLVSAVQAALAAVITQVRPDEVWLPLAVGGHVDHRTVFAARGAAGQQARFYADRPYAFVPVLLRWRLHELGIRLPDSDRVAASTIAHQLAERGCAALAATDDDCAEIARRLAQPPRGGGLHLHSEPVRHPLATLPAAAELISCYRSQAGWLFGGESVHAVWQRLAASDDVWFEQMATIKPT